MEPKVISPIPTKTALIVSEGILTHPTDDKVFHKNIDLTETIPFLNTTIRSFNDLDIELVENKFRPTNLLPCLREQDSETAPQDLPTLNYQYIVCTFTTYHKLIKSYQFPHQNTTFIIAVNLWDNDCLEFRSPLQPSPHGHPFSHLIGVK